MLTGEFNHSIDAKGRLIIPSKFRDILGEDFVITKGLDGCLFLYPNNEWKIFEEKLRTLPLTNKTPELSHVSFWEVQWMAALINKAGY